jgi:predicted ester cyclase
VVTGFLASGTQQGLLWGLSASGRRMAVRGYLVSRCQGGRIVEQWVQLDVARLLELLAGPAADA